MDDTRMRNTLAAIPGVDDSLGPRLRARLDDLTKPRGSLGVLETIVERVGLIQNTDRPHVRRMRIVTFAADHGVAARGVSAYPAAVTPQMVRNMIAGGAAVNVLARHVGAENVVVDIGVNDPLDNAPGLVRRKVAYGTRDMTIGPAMTHREARAAIDAGIGLANDAADEDVTLLGTGEMGIGNTTSAAGLFAELLGLQPREIVGRGTGIDDETLARKIDAVETALRINAPDAGDPVAVLAAFGGFEIAGICGLILGAAARRIPVVVDGFISTAGALVAERLAPRSRDFMIFSHLSDERGHAVVLDAMGVRPILNLNLRLGEGTGAALAFSLIHGAIKLVNEMATFSSAGVADRA
ncbi:MAG: nicotinate-nucleotide--dimethylbenzimidazole phosphoribosyltransferase [Deltaproteobacteria bacterium]|nr:nicotinate-nucleotide--dimethylbenzimidazole phosphoribosyltransferase [Deltaproteobacteria bacterium]